MMVLNIMFFISFMFVIGNFIYFSNRKHLLIILLSLEFLMLVLFLFLFFYCVYINSEFYFLMLFLVISVCEGSLGLSILISIIRTHGNDYFQSISIL
uniref:NADH dehydrogenase subunit 4L n=1 Tax=Apsilochorema hwangi TaxID=259356 RepID=UPI0022DCD948|nr:NADH dehydrogenase subunit 4L [Apsilochorema hwangi]UZZ43788.1 NADH dehydrogenase subunit 4L [Apsilochorema hwangi]